MLAHGLKEPHRCLRLPDLSRNRSVEGPLVGLGFLHVHRLQIQVINEDSVLAALEVPSDMRKLMQEAEPEVVDAIVPERECNDWRSIGQLERRTIQVSAPEVPHGDERNPVLREK